MKHEMINSDSEPEIDNNAQSYEAKESIMSRLYIPLGVQVSFFDKVNFGLKSNIGVVM